MSCNTSGIASCVRRALENLPAPSEADERRRAALWGVITLLIGFCELVGQFTAFVMCFQSGKVWTIAPALFSVSLSGFALRQLAAYVALPANRILVIAVLSGQTAYDKLQIAARNLAVLATWCLCLGMLASVFTTTSAWSGLWAFGVFGATYPLVVLRASTTLFSSVAMTGLLVLLFGSIAVNSSVQDALQTSWVFLTVAVVRSVALRWSPTTPPAVHFSHAAQGFGTLADACSADAQLFRDAAKRCQG